MTKKWPDLGTKYLDFDRLRGKNSYLECCFKSVWEKKIFFCLLDLSFVRWRWNFHRISHSPRTLPYPEIFLVIQIITVIQLKFFSVNVNPLLGTKLIICRALISEWRRFKNVELSAITEAATSGVLWKSCSWAFHTARRKTHVSESLFNKVSGLRPATLLKKRLWHRCFYLVEHLRAAASIISISVSEMHIAGMYD